MEFSDLITYFSQGAIVLVTLRMARSRGQNHWLWGGASILLMMADRLLGLNEGTLPVILGMAPMAFLLFIRRAPQAPVNIPEDRVICPKCKAYHATGHNFCVNCGWQLDRPYASEGTTLEDSAKVEQPEAASTLASEAPADVIPAVHEQGEAGASATVVASEQATTAESVEEQRVEPVPAEPQPKPAFRFPLTAAGLTERGVSLITQDRVQEAVDQFTKAIALDPDYRPAWAKRAEAYLRLGLSQKAEEDQRRLEGI
jgi:tetratricopeptide (TPR) repeat protein